MKDLPYLTETFDIAVVGGGSAGVTAAVAAARIGLHVALIEKYGFLGGAATNSTVMTYDGFFYKRETAQWAVGGIGKELIDSLDQLGTPMNPYLSKNKNWILPFEPESAKKALDDLVINAGVTCRLHALLIDCKVTNHQIESITLKDHNGLIELKARQFVDASGEADLSMTAGVPMAYEKEPRFAASLCARIAGIAPNIDLNRTFLETVAHAAKNNSPSSHLRKDGGFVMRIANSNDIWWMGTDIVTDGLTSKSLTEAEQQGRMAAWIFIRALRDVPGCENAKLIATGPQIGIRETRHPIALQMISESDALTGRRSGTAIARAAWNIERHDKPGLPTIKAIGGEGFFDIPMNSLKASSINNLWLAGRTIGADRTAFGSLRVMGTAFASGQAAGICAAMSVNQPAAYAEVKKVLLQAGAIL
jgi:hypothetical protein